MLAIDIGLKLIWSEHHHHVGPFGGRGNFHDLELLAFRFFDTGRALAQRDRNLLDAGIAQIERVRMTLAAIPYDGDLLALDQIDVGVTIVIYAHGLPLLEAFSLNGGGLRR